MATIGNKAKLSLADWEKKMKNVFWLQKKLPDAYEKPDYYELTDSMAEAHGSDIFNVLIYVMANCPKVLGDEFEESVVGFIAEIKEMNERQLEGIRKDAEERKANYPRYPGLTKES